MTAPETVGQPSCVLGIPDSATEAGPGSFRMVEAKVAHLTSVHPPFDVRIFAEECKSLARAGYDVTLVVPHDRDEVVDSIVIKSVPRASGRVCRMTRTVWKVYREALRQDADIYHFHDPELIPVSLLLRARGKKVIYDIHEDYPQAILSKDYMRRWIRRPLSWVMERFENFTSRRFSALVAATPAIAERFQAINSQTKVIENFAIADELAPSGQSSWNQRSASVAYVGGLTAIRGIREMVEAMPLLPERLNVSLKLAGEFYPQGFLAEVAKLSGWSKVQALGILDRPAVAQLLGDVRAGLVLFHPEPNHIKSQPNKLFEYMSAGIPVIASDFPLWREIVEGARCGVLVDPLSPQAIAQAIEYVLTHPEEAEAMGRRGRKAVEERYNWRTEERKLLALYKYLVESV